MYSSNEALVRKWFEEVWNQGRVEAIEEMMAADCVAHGLELGGSDLHGHDGFKSVHALFRGAFPDIHITVEEVIVSGDMTAARFLGWATHAGDQLGVAATNKRVTFTGMNFARWRDGKIVEGWNNVDMLGLLKQVGAI